MVHDFAIESLDLNTGPIEEGEVATATFAASEVELSSSAPITRT